MSEEQGMEEREVDDSLPPDAGDGQDIGTDVPGDDVDDVEPNEEIDDLPEVGEPDPDEEPILDELEEEDDG